MPRTQRRGLWLAAAFQLLLSLPFAGKPVHLDEPDYLAGGAQALKDPLRPGQVEVAAAGRRAPLNVHLSNSPLAYYPIALGLAVSGGRELPLRLSLLPFELASAILLYLLAGRFLRRPLLPVLLVLAGPGWWLTLHSMMLEKFMMPLALLAFYAAARHAQEGGRAWLCASAAAATAAPLVKLSGVFVPLSTAAYLALSGLRPAAAAAWLAAALAPMAALLAFFSGAGAHQTMRTLASGPAGGPGFTHQLRAVLTFLSGCAPAAAALAWPAPGLRLPAAAAAGAAALLLLPVFDAAPATAADRALGAALAGASAWALAAAAGLRREPSARLLLPWLACVLLLQTFVYWSVTARFVVFAGVPLVLALAVLAERRLEERRLRPRLLAALALTTPIGAAAAWTDAAFAEADRRAARELAAPPAAAGREVWFTGHWSLQYYMQRAGARWLAPAEGWAPVGPGDLVIVPGVNTNAARPARPIPASVGRVEAAAPLPMLLMCGAAWRCQAGFHSSAYGFLPYSFTREPLNTYELVEPK